MHDESTTPDAGLTRFEAQLAALSPMSRIDRDRVMFAAGERSAMARSRRTKRLLAGGNALLAAALVVMWLAPHPANSTSGKRASHDVVPHSMATKNDASEAIVAPDRTDVSLADWKGPTNFRLLRMWGDDLGGHLASESATPRSAGPDSADFPPSDSHSLLKRYLKGMLPRL